MALEEQPDPFLGPAPAQPEERRRNRVGYIILLLIMAMLAAIVGVLYFPSGSKPKGATFPVGGERPLDQVSDRTFPADLLWNVPLSHQDPSGKVTPDSAIMPADVAVVDGRIFILDTNNDRILEIDQAGHVLAILDVSHDPKFSLVLPMAMATSDGKLYIANSGAGNIVVSDLKGTVEKVITPEVAAGAKPLRLLGIAVAADHSIYISDADNHRVLHIDRDGRQIAVIGEGNRGSGNYGLNTPGGLALDDKGDLYVVDMLNYSVKKYSTTGGFVSSVGEAGDTDGTFSRPKASTIDGQGRLFVSDTLLVGVEVFGRDGKYLGLIGRKNRTDKSSASVFRAPYGMKVAGDTLYVIDRFAGLFAFSLPKQ